MTLAEAKPYMEQEIPCTWQGKEYYISMNVLLKKPYGKAALFHFEMLEGGWSCGEKVADE